MLRRHLAKALVTFVAGAPTIEANALWGDQLSPFVSEVVTSDDNVFRLPEGVDPQAAIGAPSAGDTYHATSAGFAFNVAADANRFEGEVALNRYRFGEFDELDFDGYGARAVWRWRAAERFTGDLGHDRSKALASLSNVQSGTQRTTPNVIDTQRTYVSATYQATPRWQFRADARTASQRNDALVYRPSDIDTRTTELTIAYVTERMTRIGLIADNTDGDLPNRQLLGTRSIDNSYKQRRLDAFIEWPTSAHSQFKLRTGSADRNYVQIPERDFNGSLYVASLDWQPSDNLTLTATSQRDISPYEEVNVGFVLSRGFGFATRWKVRDKALLALDFDRANRTYLGEPASVLNRSDPYAERIRGTGARLSLQPRKQMTIDVGWRHERRTPLNTLSSYSASIASVGLKFAF